MTGLRLDGVRPRVLAPVDLAVGAGELVFVSGPSGSGKSLLLRAVADLDPHPGEVWLGGEARSAMAPSVWRRRVGLLPAESFWWSDLVGDHFLPEHRARVRSELMCAPPVARVQAGQDGFRCALPILRRPLAQGQDGFRCALPILRRPLAQGRHHSFDRTHRAQARQANRVDTAPPPPALADLLSPLGFEPEVLGWSVARLSTGERQRLALARLLAQAPEALLLDEATANLDPANRDRVEALVGAYRERQAAAVLWVSHDPEQRARLGGRQFDIRAGLLVAVC